MRTVLKHLVGGVAMHRRHQAVQDGEIVIQDLGDGREAVGCTGSVRDDVVFFRVVNVLVNPETDGQIGAVGGSTDNDFRARREMHGGLCAR